MLSFFLIGLASPSAEAFCGTYVGGADSEFFNEYSQVAIVRKDNQTTLTIVNDIQGTFDDFALVIPVPEVLAEDDLHVIDPTVFDRLDQYSQPRLVTYECSDFDEANSTDSGWVLDSEPSEEDDPAVEIEAQYIVGEYDIVILSAEESGALFTWLNDNGYQVPGQSIDLLQEYLDGGSYFLAAKVAASAGIQSGDTLSPLQLSYETDVFGLPIRIGTLNSKEEQDLVIYAINEYSEGRVNISNYDEFALEDECMWETQGEEFGAFVGNEFSEAWGAMDGAAWMVEYSWGGGGCDPCTGTPPNGDDLISLGVDEELIHYSDYYFTRLHARYTAEQVTQDLTLYQSGILDQSQIRYIEYKWEMEDRFPVCGMGMVEEPGSCDPQAPELEEEDNPDLSNGDDFDADSAQASDAGCGGCNAGGGALLGMWVLGAGALLRRRREDGE